ncbi:Hypothetical protein NTJ_15145 [Nesidiocoris tenuis]|uniref:Uncharacterized protein n=1 Tax=Nesidiocoris tenuis TaxID=355587 RepID=A0ABN7BD79_9HEMI|nr:Hypothetical protein NTJ_15145 [Nesidiocoris tenuis]
MSKPILRFRGRIVDIYRPYFRFLRVNRPPVGRNRATNNQDLGLDGDAFPRLDTAQGRRTFGRSERSPSCRKCEPRHWILQLGLGSTADETKKSPVLPSGKVIASVVENG